MHDEEATIKNRVERHPFALPPFKEERRQQRPSAIEGASAPRKSSKRQSRRQRKQGEHLLLHTTNAILGIAAGALAIATLLWPFVSAAFR